MTDRGVEEIGPTGTVTFLFTDLEGSTGRWERDPAGMETAVARHDALLRVVFAEHEGKVFSTGGDGFAVAFARPSAALAAADAAQHALAQEPWETGLVLRARMGIHTGEAQERDGDYFGPTLNRCARLMAAGHGGQVLVSGVTASLLNLDGLKDLGVHRLKDIVMAEHIWQFGEDQFPPLRVVGSRTGNLPTPPTSFVGREDDIRGLAQMIDGARVVTLTGAGGVGKTRLAIQAATQMADRFPDGVWVCELAPVGDPDAVPDAILVSLQLRVQRGMSAITSLVDGLAARTQLVVLDNCEHVLGAVAEVVAALQSGATGVTILSTSREPLNLPGEHIWPVRSLEPGTEGQALFLDRARTHDPAFAPVDPQKATIERICARLDGIPLAIELAAARTRSMSLPEIEQRLSDRFRLLRGSGRGGLERHQTLRATVQWSYGLLTEPEQALFDRLAVFAGPFDAAAAEAIGSDEDLVARFDVVDLLAALADKSMVTIDRSGDTSAYGVLETFRQFAEERLIERGELGSRRDKHLAVYLERSCAHQTLCEGPQWFAGAAAFKRDWPQLRAAVAWAVASDDVASVCALAPSIYYFVLWTGHYEVYEWYSEIEQSSTLTASAYDLLAWCATFRGDLVDCLRLATRGIEIAGERDANYVSALWYAMAYANGRMGAPDEVRLAAANARAANEQEPWSLRKVNILAGTAAYLGGSAEERAAETRWAISMAANFRSPPFDAYLHMVAGVERATAGSFGEAESLLLQAIEKGRAAGSSVESIALARLALARAEVLHEQAAATFDRAVRLTLDQGDWGNCLSTIEGLALWLERTGRHEEATSILSFLGFNHVLGNPASVEALERLNATPANSAAAESGRGITRAEVAEYALSVLEPMVGSNAGFNAEEKAGTAIQRRR